MVAEADGVAATAEYDDVDQYAVVVVVVVLFRAVVVVVGAVDVVTDGPAVDVPAVDVPAVDAPDVAVVLPAATVSLAPEAAAMAPVNSSAATALVAPVTWRARRAGCGRRRRTGAGVAGEAGVVSMPT